MKTQLLPAGLLLGAAFTSCQAEKPNFIVFIADDMGWEDTNPYGNMTVQTPNIMRLAQEGCRYDNVFLTASSSSPSRCSIMTSLYPHSTGACELHQPLPADKELVAPALRKAGYYTMAVGKWHLGPNVKDQFDLVNEIGGKPEQRGDEWVKALRERPKDKPFFMWAAASDPHRPYTSDTEKVNSPQKAYVPCYYPDVKEVREDMADYYNEISRFDRHIGMALEELEKQGLMENTFIVVMSDNGRPFPQCKTRTNVQGMKTAFIVYYPPLVKKGSTSQALINSIDLMPTILDMAGTKYESPVDGMSFKKILSDPEAGFRQYAFAEHNWHDHMAFERAVYTDKYAFTINFLPELPGTPPADALKSETYQAMKRLYEENKLSPIQTDIFIAPRPAEELFDYKADIHCLKNLASDPALKQTADKLRKELQDHMKKTGDAFPGKDKLTPDKYNRYTGEKLMENVPGGIYK